MIYTESLPLPRNVVDFLKMEKVELTVFEKGENHQESTHLLWVYCPKRRCFYPVPPAAPVGRFFARRQFWRAFSLEKREQNVSIKSEEK